MRPRRDPRSAFPLTLTALCAALDVREWDRFWSGRGREAWAALRGRFPGNGSERPAPFWAYEPDVPDELRGDGTIADEDDAELHERRRRWLEGAR